MMNAYEVLRAMKDLPKNWNGYYGATFTDEDILFFENVLNDLVMQPTYITPSGRQSLYMKYEFGSIDLGVELFTNKVDIQAIINEGLTWVWGDTFEHCNKSFEGDFAENINDAIRECMVCERLYNQSISGVIKYE